MENRILEEIKVQGLYDLYQSIRHKTTAELKLQCKTSKKFIGYGKANGFYMYWISATADGQIWFTARTSYNRGDKENRVKIKFEEQNKDEIFSAIDNIHSLFLEFKETYGDMDFELDLNNTLPKRSKKAAKAPIDEDTRMAWEELKGGISEKIHGFNELREAPGENQIQYIRDICFVVEEIFEDFINSLYGSDYATASFLRNLDIYRQHIEKDGTTLADIADNIEISRERVRQLIVKAQKSLPKLYRKMLISNDEGAKKCALRFYEIAKHVDFDIILIYTHGLSQMSHRKRDAFLAMLFGQTTSATVSRISKAYLTHIDLLEREDQTRKKLAEKFEVYRSKICFPSTLKANFDTINSLGDTFDNQYESNLATKLKKFESIIDIIPNPDIIYYRSNVTDHRPQFALKLPEGEVALVVTVPTINMAFPYNVNRFNELHKFCKQNGYGYLIIDDRGQSIFDLQKMKIDIELEQSLWEILDKRGEILWHDIKDLQDRMRISITNTDLAAFTLGNKLFLLSKPFVIRRRDKFFDKN